VSEFEVRVDGRPVACGLAEPDGPVAEAPALLLNFATDWQTSLTVDPYGDAVRKFAAAGHRAISFDMPSHGKRIGPWKADGLLGYVEAIQAGVDPFTQFVHDARGVLDHCFRAGWAQPGRVFAGGISRGGYAAFRIAIDEPRIDGVCALAPATDWRVPAEFEPVRHLPLMEELSLASRIHRLAGRIVWVMIGNRDTRVSTDACLRTMARLAEAETAAGQPASRVWFNVVPSDGHGLPPEAYGACADYLLRFVGDGPATATTSLKGTNTQA
jgi:pimeloyl-ACP methyl ester carboxylesterase